MIWLGWRQLRGAALMSGAVLLLAAVMWIVTGLQLRQAGRVVDAFRLVQLINTTMVAVPALIGAFWGAPLVAREYETGTYRLAWTQSVTPVRWLATKFVVVGGCGTLLAGLSTLGIDWWSAPIDAAAGNAFTPALFSVRGVVPLAYTVFAFALGVACGVLLRRTLPAMAATLAVFAVVRLVVTLWIRPHFASPVTTVLMPSVVSGNGTPTANGSSVTDTGGWVLSDQLTGSGSSLREVVTSQPLDRFWSFQWWESGLFLVLAGVATLVAFERLRRRAG
jgi:hypothetical protein